MCRVTLERLVWVKPLLVVVFPKTSMRMDNDPAWNRGGCWTFWAAVRTPVCAMVRKSLRARAPRLCLPAPTWRSALSCASSRHAGPGWPRPPETGRNRAAIMERCDRSRVRGGTSWCALAPHLWYRV